MSVLPFRREPKTRDEIPRPIYEVLYRGTAGAIYSSGAEALARCDNGREGWRIVCHYGDERMAKQVWPEPFSGLTDRMAA